eukprot:6184520-Pleurochrysis_carterae.AAC.1
MRVHFHYVIGRRHVSASMTVLITVSHLPGALGSERHEKPVVCTDEPGPMLLPQKWWFARVEGVSGAAAAAGAASDGVLFTTPPRQPRGMLAGAIDSTATNAEEQQRTVGAFFALYWLRMAMPCPSRTVCSPPLP